MSRLLIVGDPHATPEDLGDCEKLIDYILDIVSVNRVDGVLFLGDLYHTHAIMHVEVMAFWRRSFARLATAVKDVHVLLGNHDMPGNEASIAHALLAHVDSPHVHVIDTPRIDNDNGVCFIPYMSDPQKFVEEANQLPWNVPLICHQTFHGVLNDNGFLAKDGVDGNLIPQREVISGHIHLPQVVGKVWYPGAPRWRTLSDANIKRAIWLVAFEDTTDEEGADCVIIGAKHSYNMDGICRSIRHFKVTPENAADLQAGFPNEDLRLDIEGPAKFVEEQKARFSGFAKIRTLVTDIERVRVRESDGIPIALKKYAASFQSRHGTPPLALERLAMERLGWA